MGVNPLIGSPFKPQFVDMRDCYNSELRKKFMGLACKHEVHIQQGVYVAQSGPTFETRAEYKFYSLIGGDAMGMSTIPECIVAN